jgi:hypothetical protein
VGRISQSVIRLPLRHDGGLRYANPPFALQLMGIASCETHHLRKRQLMGIAALHPSYGLRAKILKTTPCKVTGGALAWMLYPRKHFDTSGKSAAPFHHRAICKTAHGAAHRNCGDGP